MRLLSICLTLALALALFACDSDSDGDSGGLDRGAATTAYADVVSASYADSYNTAVALDQAVDAFIANPTDATLQAAKDAWLASREPYGQTEAYRFANGPIDAEDGPEGLLNAWPLDESYVDYVVDPSNENEILMSGIINDPENFPTISREILVGLNEAGGEENVSVGYHAIEFLLWGQDLSESGPGVRSFTDYTTADNAARRAAYLGAVSDQLLVNLQEMVDAWSADGSNYRDTFLGLDTEAALQNVFTGIGTLAKSELAVERMFVAVNNQDQEDEHSCFADNTDRDIITNTQGIANVWRGSYTRTDGTVVSGTSLKDLVEEADADLAARVDGEMTAALDAVNAIPTPFDQAIINSQDSILDAFNKLQTVGDSFVEAAAAIGIQINNELPD